MATISRPVPSGRIFNKVAFSGLFSSQSLQVDPTLTYKNPSRPKAMVRLGCWPASGKSDAIRRSVPIEPSVEIGAAKISRMVM